VDEFVDCDPLDVFGAQEVAFRCEGRMMFGIDGQTPNQVKRYHLFPPYNKVALFSPRIGAINYFPGAHTANPPCPVLDAPKLILRHYHAMGEEYLVRRYHRYASRMSSGDLRNGWGSHYLKPEEAIRRDYHNGLAASLLGE
jgi:hypothetical protein